MNLTGKRVLVTGGTRGIGRAPPDQVRGRLSRRSLPPARGWR